ncbi:hypothetical protein CK203_061956 [Vitis vinifera]|uniref:PGG domain-containing protein n=1 Tax=Vitis vinifera TaxID=29760 RepID=A0A438GF24_VITVI|nr:hypothetical protein CK203_061956 [Vitis vinifera]
MRRTLTKIMQKTWPGGIGGNTKELPQGQESRNIEAPSVQQFPSNYSTCRDFLNRIYHVLSVSMDGWYILFYAVVLLLLFLFLLVVGHLPLGCVSNSRATGENAKNSGSMRDAENPNGDNAKRHGQAGLEGNTKELPQGAENPKRDQHEGQCACISGAENPKRDQHEGYSDIQKIKDVKEKHVWSVHILEKMLKSTKIYQYDAAGRSGSQEGETSVMSAFNESPNVETNQKAEEAKKDGQEKTDRKPVDIEGNNILHLAANYNKSMNPWIIRGAALQMKWEIKWYETALEVFTNTHEELVQQGGKWLYKTSNSCSVVAALIATVAFTTTTNVPGGVEKGKPVRGKELAFQVFSISSLISLCCSVTSLVIFLGILTSRYRENEFKMALPTKLLGGLSLLLISIAAILVSFCAGHFFIVDDQFRSVAVPIYAVTCLPAAAIFALGHLPYTWISYVPFLRRSQPFL